MPSPRLVVIGGGLGGLSAGLYAASNGYRVTVLERHTLPGGACTAWSREGYTFDGAVRWILGARPGHSIHQLLVETGALDHVELQAVEELTTLTSVTGGEELVVTGELERLSAQVRELSPEDAPLVDSLIGLARTLVGFDLPLDSQGFGSWLDWLGRRRELAALLTHRKRVQDWSGRATHPLVSTGLFGLAGGRLPVSFLALLLGSLSEGGIVRLKGTSKGLARGVANRLEALGGDLRLGAEADEIVVNDGRAVGVRLTDGTVLPADRVVAATPAQVTHSHLLRRWSGSSGVYVETHGQRSARGAVLVSWGVRRSYAGAPISRTFVLPSPMELGGIPVSRVRVRQSAYDPDLAPPGCSVVQALLPGEFQHWADLDEDPEVYAAAKELLAWKLAQLLEPWFPGLSTEVAVVDVATPLSFWRFTRAHLGAYDGWLPRVETFHFDRPSKTLPGLDRLHLCGQWVENGGGVPTVLASGRQAIQQICTDDGWAFEAPR